MMQISERLRSIAECVNKGNIVADIGCDHGLTSIYMIVNNIAEYVYAMDINEGPLYAAHTNVKRYGLDKRIELRISDGIKALEESDNVQTILISGMGGQLIIDILKELNNKADVAKKIEQLVLSPQSDIHKVRKYLTNSGYDIYDERMLADGGKYYNIICALPGYSKEYKEYEYQYGKVLIEKRDRVLCEYLKMVMDKKNQIIQNLQSGADNNKKLSDTVCILKAELSDIENILEMYNKN